LVRAGGTPALPVGPLHDTDVPGWRDFRAKKEERPEEIRTAPEFGLKEVGSLFIYIVAADVFFLTKIPKKVQKSFGTPPGGARSGPA
jgi:hypothetical protein